MKNSTTKLDALEMLRTSNNKYFPMRTERGIMVSLNLIIAALELERRENAERDAKIRIGILFALHPDTSDKEKHLRTALAILDGSAE